MGFLIGLTLLTAILDWYVFYKGWKIEFLLKPLTMVFLFSFLLTSTALQGIALWYGIGVILSLAGDIFMMLPKEQFKAALIVFLLAHIAYIIGLNPTLPPVNAFGMIMAVLLGMIGARLYKRIAAGLLAQGKESLQKPVFAYTAVITIMLLSALLTFSRPEWDRNAAITVSLGAALFMLSDAILAWTKFVKPIKNGRVINVAIYHLGQILLIYGVVMQSPL